VAVWAGALSCKRVQLPGSRYFRTDSINKTHKFFYYDPKGEMRLFEQQRTHLRNILVVNSCWRPSTSLFTQRLSTNLPPCICSRTRYSFIVEYLLYHRINFYNRFLKSNTKLYCTSLFHVASSYEVPWTHHTQPNITRNWSDQTCSYFVHILVRLYTIGNISYIWNNAIYIHYEN